MRKSIAAACLVFAATSAHAQTPTGEWEYGQLHLSLDRSQAAGARCFFPKFDAEPSDIDIGYSRIRGDGAKTGAIVLPEIGVSGDGALLRIAGGTAIKLKSAKNGSLEFAGEGIGYSKGVQVVPNVTFTVANFRTTEKKGRLLVEFDLKADASFGGCGFKANGKYVK
ncbi:hypothetical protein [Chenggangzhangella methanolivorans]|uniref:Uncharacterized protein n=1 Tax=Chenggangzhangella methanolivorans TaxID=1437009 RepID=A0A9E6RDQ2_9HYPH|nr:hypothetical protein [Chenggangzhangella methanolivorans]QZN99210.1 hypothetical protein K6K41_20680 [Chenggangzhangella methanolivorans]